MEGSIQPGAVPEHIPAEVASNQQECLKDIHCVCTTRLLTAHHSSLSI